MTISPTSSVRPVTISDDGVRAVLAGTHLASVADAVIQYAQQYNVDPNFFLGYLKYESGFMDGYNPVNAAAFLANNNPGDILCVNSYGCNYGNCPDVLTDPCGDPSGNNFAVDCVNPGNGWCYTRYPDLATGVQAFFWQVNYWITNDGITDSWQATLETAGFGPGNVTEIVNDCNAWSAQYPPGTGGTPQPQPCPAGTVPDPTTGGCVPSQTIFPTGSNGVVFLMGAGIVGFGGYLVAKHMLR